MARKNVIRALAGTACVLLVAGAAGPGAAAVTMEDSGDVQATVRKTVLQTATATGEILTSRMYTQVSAVGNGTKTVLVPVGTTSNRNLNEFGAFPMEGESIQFDLTVDGGAEERTLTDADINPMEVSVKVTLDGVEIQPEDVVGASGVLDVQYTVRNTTATTSPVTYADVEGTEITEDLETADPYVGSLDVTLPQGFNEVTAPGATIAGNGQNQTSLGYSFVLFPPLGSTEVTVGYQARIDGGVMPPADFSFLPIVPFENGVIAGTTDAYRGGAAVGAQIFGAGTEIGDNLLKLQDGASQLVSGLGQLAAGATQLSDGLVNTAAPGSAELAAGADTLSAGLNELNSQVPALEDGVGDLDAGANQLNLSAQDLADGNAALAAGIAKVSKGVQDLPTSVAESVAENPAYIQLLGTLTAIVKGIGTPQDQTPDTLLGGLNLIGWGLRAPGTTDCQVALANQEPKNCGVADANEFISQQLSGAEPDLVALADGFRQLAAALPSLTTRALQNELAKCIDGGVDDDPTCDTSPFGIGTGPKATIRAQTLAAANALAGVVAGIDGKLLPGVAGIKGALYNPADGSQCDPNAKPGTAKYCGISQALTLVKDGIPVLVNEIAKSIRASILGDANTAGLGTTPPGANCNPKLSLTCASVALAAGAQQLVDRGTSPLAEGAGQLNEAVPTLASGVQQLDDGGELVADGANQLADGLGAAADGSEQLVDGLSQAEPGGAQIEQGAGDLKEQGADVLAQTGKDAQIDYARNIALLEASQQAGLEGAGIPFGSAVGTDVVTTAAVQMQLAGIAPDTENNALKFGLGALLIAGAGGAAFAAARKVAA